MVSPSRHVPDKKFFQGQGPGDRLAKWLQSKTGGNANQRITALIWSLNDMTRLVAEARRKWIAKEMSEYMRLNDDLPEKERQQKYAHMLHAIEVRQSGWPPEDQAWDLYEHINKQLAFYVGGVPALGTFDNSMCATFELHAKSPSRIVPDEWNALNQVFWLSRRGLLNRVRRCDHEPCLRWFYARFDHQVCCSEKCRIAKYRSSPEFKERKNQKQREYYHIKKYGNVL